MSRLGKFVGLPLTDRLLLVEAAWWLGVARLAMLILPFRWIRLGWGETQLLARKSRIPSLEYLDRVSWAVATAGKHLPWDCLCLAQAVAGKAMLTCRGIPSTLYLGLTRDGNTLVQGHAWLQCGKQILTGRQGMESYTVIAAFAEDGN